MLFKVPLAQSRSITARMVIPGGYRRTRKTQIHPIHIGTSSWQTQMTVLPQLLVEPHYTGTWFRHTWLQNVVANYTPRRVFRAAIGWITDKITRDICCLLTACESIIHLMLWVPKGGGGGHLPLNMVIRAGSYVHSTDSLIDTRSQAISVKSITSGQLELFAFRSDHCKWMLHRLHRINFLYSFVPFHLVVVFLGKQITIVVLLSPAVLTLGTNIVPRRYDESLCQSVGVGCSALVETITQYCFRPIRR